MLKRIIKKLVLGVSAGLVLFALGMGAYYHGSKLYHDNKAVPSVLKFKEEEAIFIRGMMVSGQAAKQIKQDKRNDNKIEGVHYTDMHAQGRKLIELVRKGVTNITIDIDSGGGMVDGGLYFVETMRDAQASGVHITCVVTGRAMSMALITFSECDTRYALFGTRLLWHSVLFGYIGMLNQGILLEMVAHVTDLNLKMWANTRKYFYPWYFLEHFKKESALSATELERESFGYLRVIKGVDIEKKPEPKVITQIVEKVIIKEVELPALPEPKESELPKPEVK